MLRTSCLLANAFLFLLLATSCLAAKPNVILMMTDDQGYGDLACHGNPVLKTPNLDKLYKQSVHLTDFHVDPTCSPTRSALMSGCYAHRVNVSHTIIGRNHLEKDVPTMADLFRNNGYKTALFGKWHLGANYPYRPIDRGFDEWLGHGDGGTGTAGDWWNNDRVNDHYFRNKEEQPVALAGYAPEVFYNRAMRFLREQTAAKKSQPFFLYLPTYVPHSPHSLPEKNWTTPFRNKVPTSTAYFFAAITRVDKKIGELLTTLDKLKLADNTIVIFMTDNGTSSGEKVFNAQMRGKKGSQYEGGHRVPCFVRWPDGGITGPRDVSQLAAHFDLLPTLIALCQLEKPANLKLDGVSLAPWLTGKKCDPKPRTLVVETQRTRPPKQWHKCSVMQGKWRLVDGKELYNIASDPSQKKNVAAQHPELVQELRDYYQKRYWPSVSANDQERARPIIGSPEQPTTWLVSENWTPQNPKSATCPWSQAAVLRGVRSAGSWPVEVAQEGDYTFEVRRWPRLADAPLDGIIPPKQKVDAWVNDQPVGNGFYGGGEAKALPVKQIRLTVGKTTKTLPVQPGQKEVTFTLPLKKGPSEVRATFLDANGEPLTDAYYVYVEKK